MPVIKAQIAKKKIGPRELLRGDFFNEQPSREVKNDESRSNHLGKFDAIPESDPCTRWRCLSGAGHSRPHTLVPLHGSSIFLPLCAS